ncbi:unnamed protein product [Dicrocoelium dendriticum]|nr:unnamed protein product [Dicrocoelium dendriticum]
MLKSSGPRMESWGTPLVICIGSEKVSFTFTSMERPHRKLEIRERKFQATPIPRSSKRSCLWGILLKAILKSTNTSSRRLPTSNELAHFSLATTKLVV